MPVDTGSNLRCRDLRRWINQQRGTHSAGNADSDNTGQHLHCESQSVRRRTTTYHSGDTRSPSSLRKTRSERESYCHSDDHYN